MLMSVPREKAWVYRTKDLAGNVTVGRKCLVKSSNSSCFCQKLAAGRPLLEQTVR